MKKISLSLLILPLLLLTQGCKLLPGRVEYFQKHVKAVPEMAPSGVERQKQAADFVATKAQETKEAAIATKADTSVIVPATETAVVAKSLSTSLGPPLSPAKTETPEQVTQLAEKLENDRAKVDQKIEKYREKTEPLVGKKIEDTGLIKMGFFTQWGIILGVFALLYAAFKVYGIVNPAVGVAGGVAERVGVGVLKRGFGAIVHGGEEFKDALTKSNLADEVKQHVLQLFTHSHERKQDTDVQELIKRLTVS